MKNQQGAYNSNLKETAEGMKLQIGTAPASASASGEAGTIIVAADYIYVCSATDTWVRAAVVTW